MSIKVNITGNGKFDVNDQSGSVISYDISDSATPLSLEDVSGEIPALNVVGALNKFNTVGATHPNSKLLIDNSITLTDSMRGSFTGKVNYVTADATTASIEAFSAFEKLNGIKNAVPFNGTLAGAFAAYFALAGLASDQYSIDSSLTDSVIFPGWNDNIWNNLKVLCAATQTEMYFQQDVIYVKPRATKSFALNGVDSESYTIELGQSSQNTIFTNLNTSWVSNALVYVYTHDSSPEQIDFNEYKEVIVTTPVSLSSINQPIYTNTSPESYIDYVKTGSIGNTFSEFPNGYYCFKDNSGKVVPSTTLQSNGASLAVELTENSYEIKLKITGPSSPRNTPWTLEFFNEYGGVSRPALAIMGTGVLTKSNKVTFGTGLTLGDINNEYPENPFITNSKQLYNIAYYTNQEICGPKVSFSFATDKIVEANNQEFGFLPGAIFAYDGSKYRVNSASYNYGGISVSAKQYVTFADFNSVWAGKTIADFNSTMLDPVTYPNEYMKYSDLAIIPLMGPA